MRTLPILLIAYFISIVTAAQVPAPGLNISHLTGGFYVYTTYHITGSQLTPSNSLYLVTDNQVVLFDTPWDEAQFQPLLDSIETRHHKTVVACIVTHYHADRVAGLQYYKEKGIDTYSSELTHRLSGLNHSNQADRVFSRDTVFKIDNYSFETYYPGAGHTTDNIVIWFAADKVLYGGCLVKSREYKTLGNIPDANINTWAGSVKKVQKKFRNAKYVIPGHYSWGNRRLLQHTIKLIKQKRRDRENN